MLQAGKQQAGLTLRSHKDSIRTWRVAGLVDLLADHTISESRTCGGYQRGSARCDGGDER
jgi:hypothetical protein